MKLSRTLAVLAVAAGTAHAAALTIYKQPGFSGPALAMHDDTRDLTDSGFVDQASSIVVHSGRWQLCSQPDFRGDCAVLQPGRYARLDATLNHRVESARPLERNGNRVERNGARGEFNGNRDAFNGDRNDFNADRGDSSRFDRGR